MEPGSNFLYLGTLRYTGTRINGQWLAKFWGPISSYQLSERLDRYVLFEGHPESALEYASVNYWILTDQSLEAAAKYSIHCFSLHRRMWNRQRKTEICEIYLPVKWVNGISFLFLKYFEIPWWKMVYKNKIAVLLVTAFL